MWDIGLAHRDVKPANLMVQSDELRLHRRVLRAGPAVPVASGRRPGEHDDGARPADRRAARLRARAAVLHARRDRRGVRRHARRGEPDPAPVADEATRAWTWWRSSESWRRLTAPIRIQRWSVRRVVLTLWVLLLAFLAVLPDRLELERVRVRRRDVLHRRSRSLTVLALAACSTRRRRPHARCAPAPTTACSSCSPSRCRRPRGSPASRSSRPAGRSGAPTSRAVSAGSGSTPTGAGIHAVEVSLRRSCDTAGAIEERPAPDEADTRVFVRPDSLNPSFTGVPVPASSMAAASTTRSASRAAPHRRSRSRPIEALSLLPRATIVAEVQDVDGALTLRGGRAAVRGIASADAERPSPSLLVRTRAARLSGLRVVRGRAAPGVRCPADHAPVRRTLRPADVRRGRSHPRHASHLDVPVPERRGRRRRHDPAARDRIDLPPGAPAGGGVRRGSSSRGPRPS